MQQDNEASNVPLQAVGAGIYFPVTIYTPDAGLHTRCTHSLCFGRDSCIGTLYPVPIHACTRSRTYGDTTAIQGLYGHYSTTYSNTKLSITW